jgi:preprotein translocase subunit SecD
VLNRYPLWKSLLILLALTLGGLYALPNLYPDDLAVQVSGASSATPIDDRVMVRADKALADAGLASKATELSDKSLLLRFDDADTQLRAKAIVADALGDDYVAALNLAPTTPDWLTNGCWPYETGSRPTGWCALPARSRYGAGCGTAFGCICVGN